MNDILEDTDHVKNTLESSTSFKNVVVKCEVMNNDPSQLSFKALVRTSVDKREDIKAWMAEFSANTATGWVVRRTRPGLSR